MDHKEGLIVGRNAVLQALESGRTIDSVTVAQGQRGGQAGRIIDICRERKIPVKFALTAFGTAGTGGFERGNGRYYLCDGLFESQTRRYI